MFVVAALASGVAAQPTTDSQLLVPKESGVAQPAGDSTMPNNGIPGAPNPIPPFVLSDRARSAIDAFESADPTRIQRALAELSDESWLDLLDPPSIAPYLPPEHVQLTHVLRALAQHNAPEFNALASSAKISNHETRRSAFLVASGECRHPGEALIALWRRQLEPEGEDIELAVCAMFQSRSEAAYRLLDEVLADESIEPELRISWFRGPMMPLRQDDATVLWADSVLKRGIISDQLRAELFDALFEYRRLEWYPHSEKPPVPPDRSQLSTESRRILQDIVRRAEDDGIITPERRARIVSELRGP